MVSMANQVDRRTLVRWLTDHGFEEVGGRASGHRKFKRPGAGSITVAGHGPQDLTKKHVGLIVRALTGMGFDGDTVRTELEAGKWNTVDGC